MPTITTTTTISLPAGKALVFAPGSGQGIAIADPSGRNAKFSVGPQRTYIGPWTTAVDVLVQVISGSMAYAVDEDGDLSDSGTVANGITLDPTAGLLIGGADLTSEQKAGAIDGLGMGGVVTVDPVTGLAGLNSDAEPLAKLKKMKLAELLEWVKPIHKPVLDPLQFVGMSPITSGVLTLSHQPAASEFPGMSFVASMSGAGTAAANLTLPAAMSIAITSGVRVGNRIHARVKCSDWSRVTFVYLDFQTEGGTTKKYRWNLAGPYNVYGNRDPSTQAAWNDVFRTFITDSSSLTASGSPAAWGTSSKYLTVTGIGITIISSAAVTVEVTRIYSPEWPVGLFAPIFDGWYSSARDYVLGNFPQIGFGAGGSVVKLDGSGESGSYHPTPSDVSVLADAGFDVFMHGHALASGNATPMTSGTTQADMLRNHSQVRAAIYEASKKTANGLKWHQWLSNAGTYAGSDLAGELARLGVNAGRGKCSDAEFGVNPNNSTFCSSDERTYQSWASARGRFNRYPMPFYAGIAPGAGYYDATNIGDSTYPTLRGRIEYAANNSEACIAYTHRITDVASSLDTTVSFMDDLVSDLKSKVSAGKLIVANPTTLEGLTYWRPGDFYMRWDGEWVYRDDPTKIAF